MKMRILRMTMSHSQIQKKNNFQPEDQISTVYKNSSFQPEHYFLGRGFFILMILFFNQLLRYHIFPARWFSTTYCDQTNIRKGYPYKQFQPLISDTSKEEKRNFTNENKKKLQITILQLLLYWLQKFFDTDRKFSLINLNRNRICKCVRCRVIGIKIIGNNTFGCRVYNPVFPYAMFLV